MSKLIKSVILMALFCANAYGDLNSYLPLKKSHLPAVYKELGSSIKKLEKTKDPKLLATIAKFYIEHHKFDKSYYPYELLAPYYGKNKKQVEDAFKKFKKSDRELAIKNLRIALDELISGNG